MVIKALFVTAATVFACCTVIEVGAQYAAGPHVHIVAMQDVPFSVTPDIATTKKGDTVVWYNRGNEPVKVEFFPQIKVVCSPLVNFLADAHGYYKSTRLPRGETSQPVFYHCR